MSHIRRVVVKVGSAILTNKDGLDRDRVKLIADDLLAVRATGRDVVLVTSGAVATGFPFLGIRHMPRTIRERQAAAAIGQPLLMAAYAEVFRPTPVAQVLLTAGDVQDRHRFLNARHTLHTLLKQGAVPIVNENDSVSFAEIKVGDNDTLSVMVANVVGADLVIILSGVEGLLDRQGGGGVIPEVTDLDAAASQVGADQSAVGTGGFATKIQAARVANAIGVPVIVAGGRVPRVVPRLVAGEPLGTLFATGRPRSRQVRKRWIGYSAKVRGAIVVDDGARSAVSTKGASVLPAGVLGVRGDFRAGDCVEIRDGSGRAFAKGLASYSSAEIGRIGGCKTSEIAARLGYAYCDEVVHRNDLILLASAPPAGAAP